MIVYQVIHTRPDGTHEVIATLPDRAAAEERLPIEQAWVRRNLDMDASRVSIREVTV